MLNLSILSTLKSVFIFRKFLSSANGYLEQHLYEKK